MDNMKKWNYVISIIMAILGAAIIYMGSFFSLFLSSGDPGPGFWPILLGAILVLCSILLAVMNTVNPQKEADKKVIFWSPAHLRVYKMMGLTALFCVAMYILGFYVSLLIFIPLAMKLMGTKSEKIILTTTLCTLVLLFVAFQIGLKTVLPAPIFWR